MLLTLQGAFQLFFFHLEIWISKFRLQMKRTMSSNTLWTCKVTSDWLKKSKNEPWFLSGLVKVWINSNKHANKHGPEFLHSNENN